jgi:hypothetical protein
MQPAKITSKKIINMYGFESSSASTRAAKKNGQRRRKRHGVVAQSDGTR